MKWLSAVFAWLRSRAKTHRPGDDMAPFSRRPLGREVEFDDGGRAVIHWRRDANRVAWYDADIYAPSGKYSTTTQERRTIPTFNHGRIVLGGTEPTTDDKKRKAGR